MRRSVALMTLVLLAVACGGAGGAGGWGTSPNPGEQDWEIGVGDEEDRSSLPVIIGDAEPPVLDDALWGSAVKAHQPLRVVTDPGELPELRVAGESQEKLPLEHTHVKARLFGFMAQVEVAQTFANPHDQPIEVVYVFPLPENSAVGAMHMEIGKRIVRAQIEEKGKARRIYTEAKQQGHTAALLEQERPNIFTQSVANIAPGEKIDVVIRYLQDLSYDAGAYEFVFPMVVGPRFIPGTRTGAPPKGTGTYADTDAVPDASRITPPVLGKGQRSGHDISIDVIAENALPIASFETPTHEVVSRRPADGSLQLTLAEKESLPNRDFVLRYRVAGKEPSATLLTSGDPQAGYFTLVVQPPELDVDELVGQRELVFVLDVSGSMAGVPLGMCKAAMRQALAKLRPVDTFNIITFSGATASLFPRSRPANRTNLEAALGFVEGARAGGGTYMADAVEAALSPDVPAGRNRYVFFLTDGYVGNEEQIFRGSTDLVESLEARGDKARVFGFGVGSSVNRYLLEGLSSAGKGIAVYATTREDPAKAVNRFYRYIDRAVLTDVEIAWGDLAASEVFPQPLPDLFASHPIILHGRYGTLASGPVQLSARAGERRVTIPVRVHQTVSIGERRGGVLGALWARSKVAHLEEESWLGMANDAPGQITKLGLDYELVTPYTSFVAVDRSRVVGDGDPQTIVQPVEVPEGVDGAMAGAREAAPTETLAAPIAAVPKPSVAKPAPAPATPPAVTPVEAGRVALQSRAVDEERYEAKEEAGYDDADAAPSPPAAERSSRGCYCDVTPGSRRGWHGWLLMLGLGVWRLRRRG